jgi:virginiamycin B lyase
MKKWRSGSLGRLLGAMVGVVALAGLGAGPASAALTPTVTDYPTDSALSGPSAIAPGPDGALWFTELNGREIGRMTVGGTLTMHAPLPGGGGASFPYGIAAGSDGAMWFVAQSPSIVGRIDSSGAILTKALASGTANPTHITSGPGGALWFTDSVTKVIGRIPASTPLQTPDESRTTADSPSGLASGPDGNLWFTQYSAQNIGRMTPAGAATYFPATPSTANPEDITAGPDGALWYVEINPSDLVRTATDGTQTAFPMPAGQSPFSLVAGTDGALWIATGDAIVRMATDGSSQTFPLASGAGASSITAGPDGNMWFNEANIGKIGRITTPPAALTTGARATGARKATVTGTADGHAQTTSFHVEYGHLGAPHKATAEKSLGTTTGKTAVSAKLRGLKPGRPYEARVVVTNPTGSSAGTFLPFTSKCTKKHRKRHRNSAGVAKKKPKKKCKRKGKKGR